MIDGHHAILFDLERLPTPDEDARAAVAARAATVLRPGKSVV